MANHESLRVARSFAPLILIGGVLLGAASFAWSQHLAGSGEVVAARVSMHGIDMSGMTPGEVRSVVAHDARTTLENTISVEFSGGRRVFSLHELGIRYHQDQTVDNVLTARRSGGPLLQLASWAVTPLFRSKADISWSYDKTAAEGRLRDLAGDLTPIEPEEPQIFTDDRGNLTFHPGVIGKTVDIDALIEKISTVDPLDPPSTIEAELVDLVPTVSDERAGEFVSEVSARTAFGVLIEVDGRQVRLSPELLRHQLIAKAVAGSIEVEFDLDGLQKVIEALIPEPIREGKKPRFEVVAGEPQLIKTGKPPTVCCDPNAAEDIAELVLGGDIEPFRAIRPGYREADDSESTAIADGSLIKKQVSSFTTPHVCCENRVKNIQRMADLVDGYYLLPGEVLSLNEFVGPRTKANGFFAAGAIRRGHLTQEVGGGVSQFATTIFNAAYFAGLDFEEYRAHSIYFSRYPYGREATISNPAPDLAIENTTAYPVLIDTSYTDTSITVSMFSTPNVEVEELEQRVTSLGSCTHVETDRQRTYEDGRVVIDMVEATYRPAEGIDCSGNRIPKEKG